MKTVLSVAILVLAFWLGPQATGQVLRPPLMIGAHATPEQVQAAIDRAQRNLLAQQQPDGSFEKVPPGIGMQAGTMGQYGGLSALATYGLLTSGLTSADPQMAKAIALLKSINIQGTYALGLRCQVWYQLSLELDPADKNASPARLDLQRQIERDAHLLLNGMNQKGQSSGMYTYLVNQVSGAYDHSCSNYGTMGVWACAQAGAAIPQGYWLAVDNGWKSHQISGAGWAYTAAGAKQMSTASMTAGGLVNLFIAQEFLDANKAADCKGNAENGNIETAIQWLGKNANVANGQVNYTLFNIQRVGFESGYIAFGDYDWYTAGVDMLLRTQRPDGSWNDLANTGFGLAFLSLGRAPVVMNKLQYEDNAGKGKFGHWNQRPRDAANITRWLEKQLHKRLNWQVVNLSMPLETLQQSPILYISGNEAIQFSFEQSEKLKHYVREGGMIVANADCGSKPFAASFRELGERLFPDYAFRPLPAVHPIFNDEMFSAKLDRKAPGVEALGNQAREFMLLLANDDAGRAWQMLPQVMQKQGGAIARDELYHLAGNLYYYSTERGQLRDKKKTWILPEEAKGTQKITVARLEYDGNWDPEPFGWEQFTNYFRRTQNLEIELRRVRLGFDALDARYKIAYLTGTGKIELTDKQRSDLKRFTYEGGVLVVDAAGGSAEFAKAVEKELKLAFDHELEIIPPGHPVFSSAAKITQVQYREKARKLLGAGMTQPVLKMIQENGKARVLFSPLDLAVGLVGQPIDSINGYQPDSAMALMMNAIMYAQTLK